jgi:hypothetical protein
MKKSLILLFLLLLAWGSLAAQEKVEIFGYFESQYLGTNVQSEFYQLFSNKLRLDLKSDLTDNITFAANFDYITYHGKKEWNILDFLSPNIISQVQPGLEPFYVLNFSNRTFLDNAYFKLSFKNFDLTVGKQQISLGTGYVWNPMDIFNIKELVDPTYEQPGHNAIRLDVPVGNAYTITALFSPDDTWKNSAKLIQFKGRISHFDYSLIAIEKVWRFHDYTQFDLEKMNFLELPEQRRLLGASTAGELFGMGVWAEVAYNWMGSTDNFCELVLGTDYTFDFQTYFMVEFYRNTLGKSDFTQYTLNDWMRVFAAEQKTISRDQVFMLVQHPVTDLILLGLQSIYSISDHSVALVPVLNYSFSENIDIMAYLNLNFGKEGTVFSKAMGNGGMLRARIYF